jgi:tol-pal system protein YbgF
MLQEQNQQLSLAFQQAMEAIKAVNGRFDAAMEAMRKGFADQALATKNMAGDVGTIAERARDSDTRLRTLSDEIKALQATLTALAGSLAQGSPSTALPPDPNAPATATGPSTPSLPPTVGVTLPETLGQSPARMLQKAKGDYDAGQYTLAITGFEQLIRTFPDTEAAIEGQYWIGESLLYLNRNSEAVTAFNTALQKGPRGQYAPSALFKRGVAQEKLGDVANAQASYEQTMKQFPNASEATLAQQRLAKLVPPTGSAPARP